MLARRDSPACPARHCHLHNHGIVRASTTSTSFCHWLALDPGTTFSFLTGTAVSLVAAVSGKSKLAPAKHRFRPLIGPRTPPPQPPSPNATPPIHSCPNADHGNPIPPGPCLPLCGDGITKMVTPRRATGRGRARGSDLLVQVDRVPWASCSRREIPRTPTRERATLSLQSQSHAGPPVRQGDQDTRSAQATVGTTDHGPRTTEHVHGRGTPRRPVS